MARTQTVTIRQPGVGMDTTDFAKFAKALRRAAPKLTRELRGNLRKAGEVVANEARVKAANASVTIPPTIKVRVSGATVAVVAGGAGVPLAGLMEVGNKGSRMSGGTFRHPVFGNDVWVTQPTHPYLFPALDENIEAAMVLVTEALDLAITEAVRSDG